MTRGALVLALAVGSACAQPARSPTAGCPEAARTMAVTIDDLPVGGRQGDLAHQQRVTAGLLRQLAESGVRATGFVNEGKLDVGGEREARVGLLRAWAKAGHDLGNHTYAHPSLFDTPLVEFQDQVRRGDAVTNRVLAERGDSVRYFRHPYLNTGPDLETKDAFEAWLADQGLAVAPVTHDNAEWLYAFAYDRARDDSALQARIADAYLAYMDTTAAYYEALSRDLFGREIAQVLLLHANSLNADHLVRLVAALRRRGYCFVPLDQALSDRAYTSEDRYVGRAGVSWLQRWALHRGVSFAPEPRPDAWVRAVAYPD